MEYIINFTGTQSAFWWRMTFITKSVNQILALDPRKIRQPHYILYCIRPFNVKNNSILTSFLVLVDNAY